MPDGDAPPTGAGGWWRATLLAVLLVAAALRCWPLLAPYQHPEQELVPQNAIVTIARGDMKPLFLSHGAAFTYALRGIYSVWYRVGKVAGWYRDRYDLVVDWIRNPLPFLIAGRVVVLVAGILTVWAVARLGRTAFGPQAGLAAGLLLAVTFIHVRESHHIWYDVPASLLVTCCVWAALRAVREQAPRLVLLAAALAGAAVGTKHPVSPVVLPVALAALLATPGAGAVAALRRLAGAGAVALAAYAVLNPYTFLDLQEFLDTAKLVGWSIVGAGQDAAPFPRLALAGLGGLLPLLAVAGLGIAAWRAPREAVVLAAFPVVYLAIIASGQRIHARYVTPGAPFVALFAGCALAAVAARLAPRHAGVACAALAVLAAAPSGAKSAAWVRLLGREDTRAQAGAWIAAHVPPGERVEVAAANGYPNPILPWDAQRVALTFPLWQRELLARGAADGPRWPVAYTTNLFGGFNEAWQPTTRWLVSASHPGAIASSQTPPLVLERLRAAGWQPVATFTGYREPLTAVYDPIDADYLPIADFDGVERPGPNLVVWRAPG